MFKHVVVVIILVTLSCLFVAVAVLAFKAGAVYGSQQAVERMKTWWRERGRNTHNPHYRVTGDL